MSIRKAKQFVSPVTSTSLRTQTVEDQPRKCVRIPVVFVESVVGDPVADSVQVEIVRAARLLKDRQEPPHASANRFVRDACRASAQRRRQELVLDDVLLVLIEPADESVDLPKSSQHLLIAEESAPQDGEFVLALDVVGEDAAAQDELSGLCEQKCQQIEQDRRLRRVKSVRSRLRRSAVESGGELDHLDEPDVVAGQLGNDPHLETLEAHNSDPRTGRDSHPGTKFVHQQSALFA